MSSPALRPLFPGPETLDRSGASSSNGGPPVDPAQAEVPCVVRLKRMGPSQRLWAYRTGRLTRHERAVWACRYPEEVPTVNGEFEWLVLGSADLD